MRGRGGWRPALKSEQSQWGTGKTEERRKLVRSQGTVILTSVTGLFPFLRAAAPHLAPFHLPHANPSEAPGNQEVRAGARRQNRRPYRPRQVRKCNRYFKTIHKFSPPKHNFTDSLLIILYTEVPPRCSRSDPFFLPLPTLPPESFPRTWRGLPLELDPPPRSERAAQSLRTCLLREKGGENTGWAGSQQAI